jgi:FMN phosphatase YigB (HAD superfamily)
MKIRALITDLDNTLYDWVTFFALAFDAMLNELAKLLQVERTELVLQFKEVHQRYGSTETPWAALELPSVKLKFPNLPASEIAQRLEPAFTAFSAARKKHLVLYDRVADTLERLTQGGIKIIGHTEALPVNAFYRLTLLEVLDHFSRIYTVEGPMLDHPFPERLRSFPPPEMIRMLPRSERKPSPAVLLDICAREGFSPKECIYVGDSRTRDVAMARAAGVIAVWAKYGTQYDPSLWELIVAVTHWTSADVEREAKLRKNIESIKPDFTIDQFSELLALNVLRDLKSDNARAHPNTGSLNP